MVAYKTEGLNRDRRRQQSWWDMVWKDRRGRVVIWQTPNAFLIAWAAFTFISLFFTGRPADILSIIGSASLIAWSLFEVFRGVNYFRRALGLLVLIFAVMSFIKGF